MRIYINVYEYTYLYVYIIYNQIPSVLPHWYTYLISHTRHFPQTYMYTCTKTHINL